MITSLLNTVLGLVNSVVPMVNVTIPPGLLPFGL